MPCSGLWGGLGATVITPAEVVRALARRVADPRFPLCQRASPAGQVRPHGRPRRAPPEPVPSGVANPASSYLWAPATPPAWNAPPLPPWAASTATGSVYGDAARLAFGRRNACVRPRPSAHPAQIAYPPVSTPGVQPPTVLLRRMSPSRSRSALRHRAACSTIRRANVWEGKLWSERSSC